MRDFPLSPDRRLYTYALKTFAIAGLCFFLLYITLSRPHSWRPSALTRPWDQGKEEQDSNDSDANSTESDPTYPNPYTGILDRPEVRYKKTLVIAKIKEEDTSWIEDELGDLLSYGGGLSTAIYVADDPEAPLHPPMNKGHEVIVYLSYIIDYYDKLPDVAIFMHAHSSTNHNNHLLDDSSAQIVRHLSLEKVIRDGYMNVRCHWEPGCPGWIHPHSKHPNWHKSEEKFFGKAFTEMFPNDTMPEVFAQPCCGQFAVARERIRQHPKEKYLFLRTWLMETDIWDHDTGRIFEYIWQYLFTGLPIHCPNMHVCYCDGFSVCFPNEQHFKQYWDIVAAGTAYHEELDAWREQADAHENGLGPAPPEGRDEALVMVLEDLEAELERRRSEAKETGKDRRRKYEILEKAWEDLVEYRPAHLGENFGSFGADSAISPP